MTIVWNNLPEGWKKGGNIVRKQRKSNEEFRIWRDTFPISNILSTIYFVEKYTLQPQNEI